MINARAGFRSTEALFGKVWIRIRRHCSLQRLSWRCGCILLWVRRRAPTNLRMRYRRQGSMATSDYDYFTLDQTCETSSDNGRQMGASVLVTLRQRGASESLRDLRHQTSFRHVGWEPF